MNSNFTSTPTLTGCPWLLAAAYPSCGSGTRHLTAHSGHPLGKVPLARQVRSWVFSMVVPTVWAEFLQVKVTLEPTSTGAVPAGRVW